MASTTSQDVRRCQLWSLLYLGPLDVRLELPSKREELRVSAQNATGVGGCKTCDYGRTLNSLRSGMSQVGRRLDRSRV